MKEKRRNPVHVLKVPPLHLEFDEAEEAADMLEKISVHAQMYGPQDVNILYVQDYLEEDGDAVDR